jgi:hypothetical protein
MRLIRLEFSQIETIWFTLSDVMREMQEPSRLPEHDYYQPEEGLNQSGVAVDDTGMVKVTAQS